MSDQRERGIRVPEQRGSAREVGRRQALGVALPAFARRGCGRGAPARGLALLTPCALAILVLVLGPGIALAAPPAVTMEPVGEHSITTAQLRASIDTSGSETTSWCFETTPATKGEWTIEACSEVEAGNPSGTAEEQMNNLIAGKPYEARLLYQSPPGSESVFTPPVNFTTDAATPPTFEIEPAEKVSLTTATIKGFINPNGGNTDAKAGVIPIPWRFEIKCEGAGCPNENWFTPENSVGEGAAGELAPFEPDPTGNPGFVPALANVALPVSRDISGLAAGHHYLTRILVTYAGITEEKEGEAFDTAPAVAPTVGVSAPEGVGATLATLKGTINPNGGNTDANAGLLPLSWRFEHDTGGGNWVPFEAEGVIQGAGTIEGSDAASITSIPVEAKLSGLEFSTEYEWRLHVTYAGLPDDHPGTSFTTEAVTKPVIAPLDPPTPIDAEEGLFLLTGHITPGGTDPGFATAWSISCEPACGSHTGNLPADNASHEVKAQLELEPTVSYTINLTATNKAGTETKQTPFSVNGSKPRIAAQVSTLEGPGRATIRAFVTPRNSSITECVFLYGPTAAYGQEAPCEEHPGNEIQQLYVQATSGQFALSFEGQTTADLPFNATAAEVQAALEGLSSVGASNVAVSGAPTCGTEDGRYKIVFIGALGDTNVEQLEVSDGAMPLQTEELPNGACRLIRKVSTLNEGGLESASSVSASLSGLQPGTNYQYTVKVANATGTKIGADWEVEAPGEADVKTCPNNGSPGVGFLPECRAWEIVSPTDKGGNDIAIDTQRTRAAADGNSIQFLSTGPFGDAIGAGVVTEYMAIRESGSNEGWTTHAITPPQEPLTAKEVTEGQEAIYVGDLAPDLSRGVLSSGSPVTENPSVANAANLYMRNDLRTPGAGNYRLITPCPLCEEQGGQPLPAPANFQASPFFAGASADFNQVLFESQANLTKDAATSPEGPRVYRWDDGALTLESYVPPGDAVTCGEAGGQACEAVVAIAAQGAGSVGETFRPVHAMSSDGSKVFFTVPTDAQGNPNISPVERHTGKLYMRIDGKTTVQLNASERTDCAGDPTCGGNGTPDDQPAPYGRAQFVNVTPDGSRVFFTSSQKLTDDETAGGPHLYMYATDKPANDPHNLTLIDVDHEPVTRSQDRSGVDGVIGASVDGTYIYFYDQNQLVRGAPSLGPEIDGVYAWHNLQLSYIGKVPREDGAESRSSEFTFGSEFNPLQGRVAADGRSVLFAAHNGDGLASASDQGTCGSINVTGCRKLYLYQAPTNQLVCVSCNRTNTPAIAASSVGAIHATAWGRSWYLNRSVSGDGRHVFFTSDEALLPEDTNGKADAYEYDVSSGSVRLLSSGADSADSFFVDASADGHDAFILTRQRFSGWDHDSLYDIYDVRVNGGLPEPSAATAPCKGESCRSDLAPPPAAAGASSSSIVGPGNPRGRRSACRHRVHRKRHVGRAASGKRCRKNKHRRKGVHSKGSRHPQGSKQASKSRLRGVK